MAPRIEEELELLRAHYERVEYLEANGLHWFEVFGVRMPSTCSSSSVAVVFATTQGHPGPEPYGFFIPADLRVDGKVPSEASAPHPPPFAGSWRFLSWQPVGWKPSVDVQTGSNLWGWVRTFPRRLEEGQ